MDNKLFELVGAATPKFNDDIVNGLAVRDMQRAEGYVDTIIRCAAADFPAGLTYEGCSRLPIEESFRVLTARHSGNSTLELARSDVYMVKFKFSWNGEEIPCYLYLPFVNDAGIIHIRGSVFSISPVLADKAISVGSDNIFIPLNRDKLTFYRQIHHFYRDGEPQSVYVPWASIYHLNKKQQRSQGRPPVRGYSTLIHYLFAKYGLHRTFQEYVNADVVVGTEDIVNPERYPPDQWVICSSTQRKPIGVKNREYTGTPLRLAIPRKDYNLTTMSMIGGFFYIADHFPDRIEAEYVDEPRLWQILLGHLIFGGGGNEGKLAEDIVSHLKSLDGYLDNVVRTNLANDGVEVADVYGLFMHVLETFSHRLTQSTNSVGSMYNKQLMVLRYVLQDITKGVNHFMYKLNSNTKKQLTITDIKKTMDRYLKLQTIMGINKKHGEVSSVSSPGDNKYFKITSQLVAQTDSSGTHGKSRGSLVDPSNLLHASIAEAGSYLTPGKSSPTGRGKVNPNLHIDHDGNIVRDPAKQVLIDHVQRRIQR